MYFILSLSIKCYRYILPRLTWRVSGAENRDGERGPFCEGWGKALPNVALGTELEEQPGALSMEHSGTL